MFTSRIIGAAGLAVGFFSAVLKEMHVITNTILLENALSIMWVTGGGVAALVGLRLRKSDPHYSKILMYSGAVMVILAIVIPAMQPGHGFHDGNK